ncbi:MAG: energy transducer TonB [Gammaproteobacteria bacterium]
MKFEEEQEQSFWRRQAPLLGGIALLVLLGIGGYFAVKGLGGTGVPEPPKVQEISLVQPPPPPPPPPKLEEPPPPEEQVEVPEPEPEPVPKDAPADEPPPGEDLGLDAEGVAGSDGFGLKAKKGGRGIIGGGDRNRWYAGQIQRALQLSLSDDEDARGRKYSVIVKLWIAPDGRVERFEISDPTGSAESDEALRRTISGLRLDEPPPADMPQPVKLRVVAR